MYGVDKRDVCRLICFSTRSYILEIPSTLVTLNPQPFYQQEAFRMTLNSALLHGSAEAWSSLTPDTGSTSLPRFLLYINRSQRNRNVTACYFLQKRNPEERINVFVIQGLNNFLLRTEKKKKPSAETDENCSGGFSPSSSSFSVPFLESVLVRVL